MMQVNFPNALPRLRNAIEDRMLQSGDWGDGLHAVCMMSAFVPGATETEDCVTAGWPKWLVGLNVELFDSYASPENSEKEEQRLRQEFALNMAEAVSKTFDADQANRRYFAYSFATMAKEERLMEESREGIKLAAEYYQKAIDETPEKTFARAHNNVFEELFRDYQDMVMDAEDGYSKSFTYNYIAEFGPRGVTTLRNNLVQAIKDSQ